MATSSYVSFQLMQSVPHTDVTELTGDKPADQNHLAEAELKMEERLLEGRKEENFV